MSETEQGSRAGSRFGPYRLIRLLGRGGMGEVYEAEDTRKHRVVALKLISEQFSSNPVFRARMQREADAAGQLTEPHVVPIHDYGEIDGQLYVEMRLIDGTNLASMLARYGPLDPPRAVAIVRQVADALDAAHQRGLMHRDVKPENILITGNDFAYLVDFGIARAATDPGLTQTGTAIGSYNYMAPERFSSNEVTYRADIYALACVLGECLTGSPPFRANSIERLIAAHLMEPAPRPSQLRPGLVPVALDEVIARGMAKNPAERYRTAIDLASAAHDALTGPEQRRATTIARARPESSPDDDATMARPVPTGAARLASTPSPAHDAGNWPRQHAAPSPVNAARPPDLGPPANNRDKRKLGIIAAAALLLIAVVSVTGYLVTRSSDNADSWASASGQTALPFNGLDYRLSPGGVALDSAGNVYVTSQGMYGRVVKLAPGSDSPTVLPFNGLYQPQGLAVDGAGAVYVTDFNNRVVKLADGSNDQMVLPFDGLNYPEGVAVDNEGSVYVADRGNDRVVKLAAGSNNQTVLPFDGLNDPDGVAVGADGSVYVTDTDNNRVLMLAAGSSTQSVLPFTEITVPWGIAVDTAGAVYVTEQQASKVVKLAAGANSSTVLPFDGLNTPLAVTVDKAGDVYVADRGNDRAVKLAS